MIFYSCVPEEVVFENWDMPQEPIIDVTVNGLLMQVQPVSAHQARIVRLISPDPQQYLNPAYAPGQWIEYRPYTGTY
ncbi:YlzJ-like family protein [Paenibacillus koleovorans]|uniref:YlzJ-like family protein n=1 Tax=Paenibacillus koleovorans TaxID=121608 RepID=UPI000FD91206|nr:YlzJ-like family protein [Paenibacillus koleovorans]